jgi:hypothetical protein
MDAMTIATTIAEYLRDRDDVAEAYVDDPFVRVTTQAGERYTVHIYIAEPLP